jgi:hypothetical protein
MVRVRDAAIKFMIAMFAGGCAADNAAPASVEGTAHLQRLGGYYRAYAGGAQGQAPPNEPKFRQYLQRNLAKGERIDELLASPRDGQPYVIAYGIKLPSLGSPQPTVLIHERTGVDGVRLYLTSNLTVRQANEDEFAKLEVPKN